MGGFKVPIKTYRYRGKDLATKKKTVEAWQKNTSLKRPNGKGGQESG